MKPIQVYLPEAEIKRLKLEAIERGTTISDIVREALGSPTTLRRAEDLHEIIKPVDNGTKCRLHKLPVLEGRTICGQKGCK